MPCLVQQWSEVSAAGLGLQWIAFVARRVSELYREPFVPRRVLADGILGALGIRSVRPAS